jgi:hypothetical protein
MWGEGGGNDELGIGMGDWVDWLIGAICKNTNIGDTQL